MSLLVSLSKAGKKALLIAEAELKGDREMEFPSFVPREVEWYPASIRFMVIGFILLFKLLSALIYSIARILFGCFRSLVMVSFSFGNIAVINFSLAAGKERPDFKYLSITSK